MNYHQKIFELIGIDPVIDAARISQLEWIEQTYDITLPPSVKEWFSIENLPFVLDNFSSFSWQATITDFCSQNQVEGLLARNNQYVKERKLIPILKEKEDTWLWLLNLQETHNDPKIVLQTQDFPDMVLSHPHRFVKQVFLNVWDFVVMSNQFDGFYLKASCPPSKPDYVEFLRSHFNEISTTFMLVINETTCRLQKKDHFIRMVEDGETTQWQFYARNEKALERMLTIVLQLKPIKKHILPVTTIGSNSDVVHQILDRLR